MIEPTELVDADLPRVDLVKGPAHGLAFLVAKAAATHATDPDTGARRQMASSGAAMPNGAYPIETKQQLEDAIHGVGRGSGDHNAIRRHIIRRAETLGAKSMIPENWNADGSLTVAKAADEQMPDADDVLAEGTAQPTGRDVLDGQAIDAPGDPDDPDSAAWEAVDAARARQMVAAVTALKQSLTEAADREATEAVTGSGDDDDADNACDLDCAQDALDYLLGVLAPFAATEQAEADERAATLMKAVPLVKAGRVLSAANLAAVRSAITALQEVEAAAKPAPAAAEETPMTEPAEPVVKAKGDPQVLVYDANGNVLGSVDPTNMTTFATPPSTDSDGDNDGDTDGDTDATPDAPADADDPQAADGADGSAEPAADAQTIPGTNTVQAPPDDSTPVAKASTPASPDVEVLKSAFASALKEALGQQEDVIKTSLTSFEERLARMEATPAPKSPVTAPGSGVPGLTSRDSASGPDQFVDLRKRAADPALPAATRQAAAQELAYAEIRNRFAS